MDNTDRSAIYCVEGNIGSGKSTLIDTLQKRGINDISHRPIVYLQEPVPIWEKIVSDDGKNMIELFYANQEKYAFSFQMMAYISRLSMLQDTIQQCPNSIIICERSLLTDYFVFAKMLHACGKMSLEEFTIYKKWFFHFIKDIHIAGIIYIYTQPETAHGRCNSRGREGEKIDLEYLRDCHEAHDEWINNTEIPVLKLDGNPTHSDECYTMWTHELQKFVNSRENNGDLWVSFQICGSLFMICLALSLMISAYTPK
jgi:deoxyadenosine/deoxycytidine kinase